MRGVSDMLLISAAGYLGDRDGGSSLLIGHQAVPLGFLGEVLVRRLKARDRRYRPRVGFCCVSPLRH
jgi:hypothetical protein